MRRAVDQIVVDQWDETQRRWRSWICRYNPAKGKYIKTEEITEGNS